MRSCTTLYPSSGVTIEFARAARGHAQCCTMMMMSLWVDIIAMCMHTPEPSWTSPRLPPSSTQCQVNQTWQPYYRYLWILCYSSPFCGSFPLHNLSVTPLEAPEHDFQAVPCSTGANESLTVTTAPLLSVCQLLRHWIKSHNAAGSSGAISHFLESHSFLQCSIHQEMGDHP